MPTFEAVEGDPFAAPPSGSSQVATPIGDSGQPIPRLTVGPSGTKLEAVDHDPFATDYGGLAKAGGIGVAKGGIGLAGMAGDLQALAGKAADWITYRGQPVRGLLPSLPEPSEQTKRYGEKYSSRGDVGPSFPLPTSHDIQGVVEKVTGPFRQPQNQAERDAETAGEFLPAALAGPGGLARKVILQDAVPAAASIVAGRYSDQNPYVKALAGFLGGAAGAVASGPSSVQEILRSKIPASVTEQHITRAGQLIEHAQQRGVALTWPEALSRVTGQPVLTDMQRILESHGQTRGQMNEFFANRPAQMDRAALDEFSHVSPGTATPSQVGPQVGQAANESIGDVRKTINAASEPFYKNAESVLLTPKEMALVHTIPGFKEARDAVRNGPNAWRVEHLPDESVGFLNAVKKHFDTQAENAASKFNPARNKETQATHEMQASAVKQIAEIKSADYATALAIQQQARERYLQPLLDGPLGRLAKKDVTTQKAIDALFPSNPVGGSHHEIADAVSRLAAKNPGAATQLVRAHLESAFNEATRSLQGGANQFGGASFAKALVGNPQQRENLRAAVDALPNGAARWDGLEHLLDIMAATGTRQPKGSLTAFNALEVPSMTSAGVPQLAAKGLSPSKWMSFANDTFNSWSLGRNLDQLARVITDPGAGHAFNQIVRIPAGSNRALAVAGRLIGQLGAATTEQRNQPRQANGH